MQLVPGHCTGLFGSRFQVLAPLQGLPPPFAFPILLCRLSSDPSSRDPASSPHYVVLQFLHPCPSRFGFILRLACWCTNRGATSRYFCRFYFGEHLVVGTRTKETCSLRKSQEARGWLAPAVRLIYLFLVT